MKEWKAPSVSELNISCTEQGKHINEKFDEIRVDGDGNYWASFVSGADSKPETNGPIYRPEDL